MKIDPRIPDIFGVGAAKAGTTSLWRYLNQHPQLFSTSDISTKELGYFSNQYGISDLTKYLEHFSFAKESQLKFEFCHAYLTSSESAALIHEANSDARILICLRNPVDRAYSLYKWATVHGYEIASSFEEALRLEEERAKDPEFRANPPHYFWNYMYKGSGLYSSQVKRYLDLFGDRVKVIIYEDFSRDLKNQLNEICDFLEIDEYDFNTRETFNKGKSTFDPRIQFYLKQHGRIVFRGPLRGFEKRLMKWNIKSGQPKLNERNRIELSDYFREDISQLEILLDRKIKEWYE